MHRTLRESATAGALLVAVGALAVLTGRAFLFPSLGPSAYLLATRPTAGASSPRRVVGGHLLGLGAGLLSYHGLAAGLVITASQPPLSAATVALAASAVVSVVLTTAAMVTTGLRHAPACATTLIVSLGLLSSVADAVLIAASIVVLVASHRALVAVAFAPARTVADRASSDADSASSDSFG